MRHIDDTGQTVAEYALILGVFVIIVLWLLRLWAVESGGSGESATASIVITGAPYTLSTSEGGGLAWASDILLH